MSGRLTRRGGFDFCLPEFLSDGDGTLNKNNVLQQNECAAKSGFILLPVLLQIWHNFKSFKSKIP